MISAVFGRVEVLDRAMRALGEHRVVVLEGPAGIGKTAVLRELVRRAREDGRTVLGCAPTEAEHDLPLAAIADVLQPLREHAEQLPGPQRAAVDAALLLDDDLQVDERALGAATRTLLKDALTRAASRVVVTVDDAPWLDPPSERALRFAVRRLPGLAMVITARTDGTATLPLGLDATPERAERITLTPLGSGPLHHLIADRFETSLGRPLLARIAHDSGGNPLLAAELARAVLRLPVPPAPGDDLPVAASLQELVAATLGALPDPAQHAVGLAALLTTPRLGDLTAAGADLPALEAAESAGLVTVDVTGRVRFAHPMYAAAVRSSLTPTARRRLHGTIAAATPDPDERALHLARATVQPDAGIADDLDAAAARRRARGAPELAAGLYDRAAALTPADDPDGAARRRLAAAHCRFDAGDYGTATAQAERMAADATGDARAEALLLRAAVAWSADDVTTAARAAGQALEHVDPASPLAGRIHAHLAIFVDDPSVAGEHASAGARLLAGRRHDSPTRGLLGQSDRSVLASALSRSSSTRCGPDSRSGCRCSTRRWRSRVTSRAGWPARSRRSSGRASTTTPVPATACSGCSTAPSSSATNRRNTS
ncbi:MAG: AAA family ATPase [Jatrophihabitans sp.]|uniref:AAA family ATPase n=1 Tax=Jatrophihabitans sp. TaxID=1932789 RepID=UPI003F7D2DA0